MCRFGSGRFYSSILIISLMMTGITGCSFLESEENTEATTEAVTSSIDVSDEELAFTPVDIVDENTKASYFKVTDLYLKDNYSIMTFHNDNSGDLYIYTENNDLATVVYAMSDICEFFPNYDGEVDTAISADFNIHQNGGDVAETTEAETEEVTEENTEDDKAAEEISDTEEEKESSEETTEAKVETPFAFPIYKLTSIDVLDIFSNTVNKGITSATELTGANVRIKENTEPQANYGTVDADSIVTTIDEEGHAHVVEEKTTEVSTESTEEPASEESTENQE